MAYALRSRLHPTVHDVLRRCQLARYSLNVESQYRCFASRNEVVDAENDRPTKYTTSRANSITAQAARKLVTSDDSPWSQTISLMLSLASFLIYFGILREPNDLDDLIDSDIYDKVPGLQEVQDKLKTRAGREAAKIRLE